LAEEQEVKLVKHHRPEQTQTKSIRCETGCGHLYVTPGWDGDFLVEIFASLGKAGSCPRAMLQALTRSVSLGLKYGIPVEEYIEELIDIKCPYTSWDNGKQILSCADAIGKVLQDECRNNKSDKVSK